MSALRVEDIASVLEIQALKARYFQCVDGKDWPGLRALFSADGSLFFPEAQEAPLPVADAIDFISRGIGEGVSIHHGHMPMIDILSAIEARGVWAMEDRIIWPADRPSSLGLRTLHGYGHYHEDYVRIDDRWLIRRLKVVRIHTTAVPAGGDPPDWAR
jgi:hypothetical protein